MEDYLGIGGVFHGAVEVYHREWSYGATRKDQTGVFCCKPKLCPMHTYKQSIYMARPSPTTPHPPPWPPPASARLTNRITLGRLQKGHERGERAA